MKKSTKTILFVIAIIFLIAESVFFYIGCKQVETSRGQICQTKQLLLVILIFSAPSIILILISIFSKKEIPQEAEQQNLNT